MHTLYILYSAFLDKYYIGSTSSSVNERLQKHLSNHTGFTSRAKDWIIVYTEIYALKAEANRRERQIKNWKNKIRISELIKRISND